MIWGLNKLATKLFGDISLKLTHVCDPDNLSGCTDRIQPLRYLNRDVAESREACHTDNFRTLGESVKYYFHET